MDFESLGITKDEVLAAISQGVYDAFSCSTFEGGVYEALYNGVHNAFDLDGDLMLKAIENGAAKRDRKYNWTNNYGGAR